MRLENYLCDGANWQAVGVMAYLRSHALEDVLNDYLKKWRDKLGDWYITIGRYENCREQGYIVSFNNVLLGEQFNYCFYEHRNTDYLCVVRFKGVSINTPTLDKVLEVMRDKYDYTTSFMCGNIMECGEWIINDVCIQFNNYLEEKFGD